MNRVLEVLGCKYPITCGAMTWVSEPNFVAAVSNAGAMGVLASGNMPPEILRKQIHDTRKLTDKPFGVNLILIAPNFEANLKVVMEEVPYLVTFAAGNPGKHIEPLKNLGIKVVPVMASVSLAKRMERYGADAIIAEGQEAGGHIGDTATLPMIPQMVDAIDLPVIAAGGIADGRGAAAVFAMGARGIQLGTGLVVADECQAHDSFKNAIITASDRATAVTGRGTGAPVRARKNMLTTKFKELEKSGASLHEIEEIAIGRLREAVIDGNMETGSLMMGQCAGLVGKRGSVKEIIEEIIAGANETFQQMGTMNIEL